MPGKPWGIRSIPRIETRYPLWEQPNLMADVDAGGFYLPDAEEGRRETLITSALDARPVQCQRLPGSSFVTLLAALTTGGFFVFGTYHWWTLAGLSLSLAMGVYVYWIWTGTAHLPEKEAKDVGLGLTLPLYVSGSASIGWWGMLVTMLADLTAFICLVFGYFFFWTIHDDFPPRSPPAPGLLWSALGGVLAVIAWSLTVLARRWNRQDFAFGFYAGLSAAALVAVASAVALVAGCQRAGLDPTHDAYAATVWMLMIWTALHVMVGVIMQLYCLARRAAGRMTARHDIDLCNVTLYWHFTLLTAVMAVAVTVGFPWVAR